MIADLNPYTGYKEPVLPCLGLVARCAEISADILDIEKEGEEPLGELLGGHMT